MPNMSQTKVAMPEQETNVRNKNFLEVSSGYTEEMALEEATRCLNCKHRPCIDVYKRQHSAYNQYRSQYLIHLITS